MVNEAGKSKLIREELIRTAREWASRKPSAMAQARDLRREAVRLNHFYYFHNIPAYRKLAADEKIGDIADMETIKRKLTFSDGIYKSYQQYWLDKNDYVSMNHWLSGIFHRKIDVDTTGISSIDDWANCLETAGIKLVFSSGTSLAFSFVPRESSEWITAKNASITCLAPLLASRVTSPAVRIALKMVSPESLIKSVAGISLKDFDAVFLGFRWGRMGNQALLQELAPLFPACTYLYDLDATASALRELVRGTGKPENQEKVARLQEEVAGSKKERNYLRVVDRLRHSASNNRKVFIFGAPYQFKELCETITTGGKPVSLKKGSLALFGGGWKSFSGASVEREQLITGITSSLNLPPEMVLEGYSMTEISVLMLRCHYGRFHIPPLIEPVVYNEELEPQVGRDLRGRFGFLDTLAVSHPGFVISGDYVHLVDSECRCGLIGPAIMEISRATGQETKGCGGIMGSLRA